MVDLKRIVIKLGSSVILKESGELNYECLKSLVREMAELQKMKQIIIVSSGAIGIGRTVLRIARPRNLSEKQALASVGQARLIQVYENLFSEYGIKVGQVLLTREDLQDRYRYLNARNTLFKLLDYGVIPVINENDTVAVEEIKFGDNDTLSALIASKMDADLLIILSDVEGVYRDEQRPELGIFKEISEKNIAEIPVSTAASAFGAGGIATKIEAAKIMIASGIPMVLARGDHPHILLTLVEEFRTRRITGTWFISGRKLSGRKRWIAFSAEIKGSIVVDNGAAQALRKNKSLLPSGIKEVDGDFVSGDVVKVLDSSGQEIARGLVYYSSDELRKIAGKQTCEIESILGYRDYDEVIHSDNLALL